MGYGQTTTSRGSAASAAGNGEQTPLLEACSWLQVKSSFSDYYWEMTPIQKTLLAVEGKDISSYLFLKQWFP